MLNEVNALPGLTSYSRYPRMMAAAGLPLGDVIDFAKERTRLEKELKKAQDEIARFDAKLGNEQFVSRAPEDVLTEQREKRAEAAALATRLSEAVARLA